MRIKEILKSDRPREKALRFGIDSVTDKELLAIIIGTGVKNKSALEIAGSLLINYSNIFSLSKAKFSALKNEQGLSEVSALKLEATFEFYRRIISQKYEPILTIKSSEQVYEKFSYLKDENQEQLALLMLDSKSKILKEKIIYIGTENSIAIDAKEIVVELVQTNASKFYLIHNHPDGEYFPSEEDIYATLEIKEKCKILGIKLLDHIIITNETYFSFLKNHLLTK